jgi:hypothetical protein
MGASVRVLEIGSQQAALFSASQPSPKKQIIGVEVSWLTGLGVRAP